MKHRIGVHVPMHHSLKSQQGLGADVVQILLGSPQRWGQTKAPKGDAASPIYVHAPYLINLSTHSKELLHKSRQTLWSQDVEAANLGALGLTIHGGSWKKTDSQNRAIIQWAATLGQRPYHTKILVENAANGNHSLSRYLKDLEELWRVLGGYEHVGFTLDTAHLWASGMMASESDVEVVRHIRDIVGRIDLVHANGSSAPWNSGQDRHSPLDRSLAPPEWVAEIVQAAGVQDVIAETTDPSGDIKMLRRLLE